MTDKQPTRIKVNIVDREGVVLWSVLSTDPPEASFMALLTKHDLSIVRANPDGEPVYDGPKYSIYDPAESVLGAIEAYGRIPNLRNNVLMYLIRNNGEWCARDEIRRYGGDSGDRRVRELRDEGNWPIGIKQLDDNDAWHVRMELDPHAEAVARESLGLPAEEALR